MTRKRSNVFQLSAEPPGVDIMPIIDELQTLAASDALSSLAVAWVNRDGSVDSAWSLAPNDALLLGAIHKLAHRYTQD